MRSRLARSVALAVLAGIPALAFAQTWPSRPITVINGFSPGSIFDMASRAYSAEIQKRLGVAVVNESRPGAATLIASQAVAKSPPDGYTFSFGSQTLTSGIFIKNNPIVVPRDLTPVADLQGSPLFVYVRSSLPINTYDDLVAYAKANPGKLNYGSNAGPIGELMVSILNQSKPGLTYAYIPYKGTPEVVAAMLGGEIDFTISTVGPFPPAVQSGKLKILMSLSNTPSSVPLYGNVPLAKDSGVKYQLTSGTGFWAPGATPGDIIQKMGEVAIATLSVPEVVAAIRNAGGEPEPRRAAAALQNYFEAQKYWQDAAKAMNFQAQ